MTVINVCIVSFPYTKIVILTYIWSFFNISSIPVSTRDQKWPKMALFGAKFVNFDYCIWKYTKFPWKHKKIKKKFEKHLGPTPPPPLRRGKVIEGRKKALK